MFIKSADLRPVIDHIEAIMPSLTRLYFDDIMHTPEYGKVKSLLQEAVVELEIVFKSHDRSEKHLAKCYAKQGIDKSPPICDD